MTDDEVFALHQLVEVISLRALEIAIEIRRTVHYDEPPEGTAQKIVDWCLVKPNPLLAVRCLATKAKARMGGAVIEQLLTQADETYSFVNAQVAVEIGKLDSPKQLIPVRKKATRKKKRTASPKRSAKSS